MKTKEELEQLRIEYRTLSNKFKELDENELKQIIGGIDPSIIDVFNTWEVIPTIQSVNKSNQSNGDFHPNEHDEQIIK